jgi:Zn-dependent protease
MTLIIPGLMLLASHGTAAFGGAKPCPVNPSLFRNYRRGDIIVSLAGVTMNMFLAIIAAVLFLLIGLLGRAWPDARDVLTLLQRMMFAGVWLNIILVFFNLIPFPPLDGSHVLKHFLPSSLAEPYVRFSRFGLPILMLVCFYASGVIDVLLTPAVKLSALLLHPVLPYALASM